MSPTQRTLAYLRSQGYTAAVTEHWNPHAKIRQDLFGFIDIIALGKGPIIAVQCTSGANHSARVTKIVSDPKVSSCAMLWLKSCNSIAVISWSKKGARGRLKKWEPRIQVLSFVDFPVPGSKPSAPIAAHLGSC